MLVQKTTSSLPANSPSRVSSSPTANGVNPRTRASATMWNIRFKIAPSQLEKPLLHSNSTLIRSRRRNVPILADAAGIILTLHERHDGSGYPRGLKAEEILLGARIFAVGNRFDAITSDRPYHRATPFDAGRETIQREAGQLFDPPIVSVFLGIPAETRSTIARGQRQIAVLQSRTRQDNAILRLDPSVSP